MAKSIAFLEYAFLFDPSNTWQHVSQFEGDLAVFLKQHNMEAQVLDNINPKSGRRVIFIRSIPKPEQMGKQTPQKVTSPQDVIKKYSNSNSYKEKK